MMRSPAAARPAPAAARRGVAVACSDRDSANPSIGRVTFAMARSLSRPICNCRLLGENDLDLTGIRCELSACSQRSVRTCPGYREGDRCGIDARSGAEQRGTSNRQCSNNRRSSLVRFHCLLLCECTQDNELERRFPCSLGKPSGGSGKQPDEKVPVFITVPESHSHADIQ